MTNSRRSPETLGYTKEHEWVESDGSEAIIGITPYAAGKLGDIVYVDLPSVGDTFAQGEVMAEIESTKSVGELFAPLDGKVVATNVALSESPGLVNSDPFGDGWIVKVEYDQPVEFMSLTEYTALTEAE